MLTGSTLVIALAFVTGANATYATEDRTDPLPGWVWAVWVPSWAWGTGLGPILTFLLLSFPEGRLPSPRWRPVAIASAVVMGGVLTIVGVANPEAELVLIDRGGARSVHGVSSPGS